MRNVHLTIIVLVIAFVAGTFMCPNDAAASEENIDGDVKTSLEKLYETEEDNPDEVSAPESRLSYTPQADSWQYR